MSNLDTPFSNADASVIFAPDSVCCAGLTTLIATRTKMRGDGLCTVATKVGAALTTLSFSNNTKVGDWGALHGARFRQKFTLADAIGSHSCSFEANMRVTNSIPLGSPPLLPLPP
jgi:hypothetical protein